jgi:hypothetical protein
MRPVHKKVEETKTKTKACINGNAHETLFPIRKTRRIIVEDDDETFLVGDTDGNLYVFDEAFTSDDGELIVSTFTTRDYPLNDAKHAVRLAELVLGFRDQDAGQIMVRASPR